MVLGFKYLYLVMSCLNLILNTGDVKASKLKKETIAEEDTITDGKCQESCYLNHNLSRLF